MVEVNVDTEITGDVDFDGMIARFQALDGTSAEAGLFDGFAAEKAMWNEYGTSRGIPARPFLRNTLYEQSAAWSVFIGPKIAALVDHPTARIQQSMGQKMAADIRKTIDRGGFAPLSPATIAKKHSDKALVDTSDMYNSITWRKEKA